MRALEQLVPPEKLPEDALELHGSRGSAVPLSLTQCWTFDRFLQMISMCGCFAGVIQRKVRGGRLGVTLSSRDVSGIAGRTGLAAPFPSLTIQDLFTGLHMRHVAAAIRQGHTDCSRLRPWRPVNRMQSFFECMGLLMGVGCQRTYISFSLTIQQWSQ